MCNVYFKFYKKWTVRDSFKAKKIAQGFCVIEVEEPVISEGQEGM